MSASPPLLAATMIVRDEEAALPDCLASLAGVVDEIVVYDTGSRDRTRELAREAGARVVQGYWDGDFARARNEALSMTRATWVLVLDADERLVAAPGVLRSLLIGNRPLRPAIAQVDALRLLVVNRAVPGQAETSLLSLRVFRRERGRWYGRVHENVRLAPASPVVLDLPPEAIAVEHLGYLGTERVRAKAQRNLELAQAELDELVASGSQDRSAAGRVLFELARSCLAVGERQRAVDALETLLEIAPAGRARAAGTALLAQVLLDEGGYDDLAVGLIDDLAGNDGVDPRYVDWLRAQALDQAGQRAEALELLRGIEAMTDPLGAPSSMGKVLRARAIIAARLGRLDEARGALGQAVAVEPSLAPEVASLTALLSSGHGSSEPGVRQPGSITAPEPGGPGGRRPLVHPNAD